MASASEKFVNLEEIVRELWAWQEYDRTAFGRQKKLRAKDKRERGKFLHLEIDWSETRFHDETRWTALRPDTEEEGGANKNHVSTGAVRSDVMAASGEPCASVLFQTRFTNNTKGPQEYTMKTEKRTNSSLMTEVENGFTKGVEMSVKLASPCEVFEANAGYKREFTLTNIDGETFEEEMTWGVESLIRVDAGHVAEASLVVDERKQAGDFVIITKISGPVYATFTAPRDNNSFVKSCSNDIANVVRDYLDIEKRKGRTVEHVSLSEDGRSVIVRTKGRCRFRYGVKQEIRVDQKPLNDQSKTTGK